MRVGSGIFSSDVWCLERRRRCSRDAVWCMHVGHASRLVLELLLLMFERMAPNISVRLFEYRCDVRIQILGVFEFRIRGSDLDAFFSVVFL